jgi:TolB-like protein/Tfp pilus assembly protein PilF
LNKLSLFWQELKRRKVVRVITVYAAAAFVILELLSIIIDPLRLPDWTLQFAIVFLCIGFIIAVILSWIYDVHPEGGVVKTEPTDKVKAEESPKSLNSWKIASYISFIVIVALIILNIIPRSNNTKILEKSIAILPFENLSAESGNEFFVDGLVEDLLNRISVIEDLKVISRTSSEMYRERGLKTVPQIAEELNVSYILEGSVQRYGDKARITVQLIDARNDDNIWADNYDQDIRDVFQTQSEIAFRIASELDAILTSVQKEIMQGDKTSNIEAFELYQMGLFFLHKRTEDGCKKSIEYFEQAIEKDPGYGLAYAGLADSYHILASYGWIELQEGMDKAVELALKALDLDANLAEAYTVLATINDYVDWEWEKAENAFQRALELNPNFSTTHHYYAAHLSIIGRHQEARIHMNKAVELNPLSFIIRNANAKFYYHQGYFEEALKELDISDDIQKGHFRTIRYRFYTCWQLGLEEKAFAALRTQLTQNPRYDLEIADSIFIESGIKAVLEWKTESDLTVVEEEHLQAQLSDQFALLGKYEDALYWLEKSYQLHQTPEMSLQYQFQALHNHPGYRAILEGMGLDGYFTDIMAGGE